MFRVLRYLLIVISLMSASVGMAQNERGVASAQPVSGAWFASGLYSINLANNGMTYSRAGLMGGYLKNWGGYLKVDFPISVSSTPNISAGATKRLATFNHSSLPTPSALYICFGLGYGEILHGREFPEHDHIYHPDGTTECIPGTDRVDRYWDSSSGILAEVGLIYRYRHINFMLGGGITPDIFGGILGGGNSANIAIQVGVGYTF